MGGTGEPQGGNEIGGEEIRIPKQATFDFYCVLLRVKGPLDTVTQSILTRAEHRDVF